MRFLVDSAGSHPRTLPEALKERPKKVVSNSVGLVDFAIRLVNSVFNLPEGQVKFCGIRITEEL